MNAKAQMDTATHGRWIPGDWILTSPSRRENTLVRNAEGLQSLFCDTMFLQKQSKDKIKSCMILDSTRRGKRFPDSFTRTIPMWCCAMNQSLPIIDNLFLWRSVYPTRTGSDLSRNTESRMESSRMLPGHPRSWNYTTSRLFQLTSPSKLNSHYRTKR